MKRFILFLFTFLPALSLVAQIDAAATCETEGLYRYLKGSSSNYLLFGHQNTTLEGLGWKDPSASLGRSDVWAAVQDYPAVYGYDFVDGYEVLIPHIKQAYQRGGIITISHHMLNPSTGGPADDIANQPVSKILEEGTDEHANFISMLDRAADVLDSLSVNGIPIPIIFRPLHENSGSWFWWGKSHCTAEEFVALWQMVVTYLRDERGLHHLLYAYSPSRPLAEGGYGDRYPGDEYVDIIGFDYYGSGGFSQSLINNCRFVVNFAESRDKVAALTEFGVTDGIQNTQSAAWFLSEFLFPIKEDSIARNISFALTWRNASQGHHWVPLPGSQTHLSFESMYWDEFTVFASDLPDIYNCLSTDLKELITESDLHLFPNPAKDLLHIELDKQIHQAHIHIRDLMGKEWQNARMTQAQASLDVSGLPNGIYWLEVAHLQKRMVKKFVVRR